MASPLQKFMRSGLSQQRQATRSFPFFYPHSFKGKNAAFQKRPTEDNYENINRNFQEGEHAPLAQQKVRKFPDWYKPYSFNYHGEGYFLLFFLGFIFFGSLFEREVRLAKGRTQRKELYGDQRSVGELRQSNYAQRMLDAEDPDFVKFTHAKPRPWDHH